MKIARILKDTVLQKCWIEIKEAVIEFVQTCITIEV